MLIKQLFDLNIASTINTSKTYRSQMAVRICVHKYKKQILNICIYETFLHLYNTSTLC